MITKSILKTINDLMARKRKLELLLNRIANDGARERAGIVCRGDGSHTHLDSSDSDFVGGLFDEDIAEIGGVAIEVMENRLLKINEELALYVVDDEFDDDLPF